MKLDLKLQLTIFHGAILILGVGVLAALQISMPVLGIALLMTPAFIALFTRTYGLKQSVILISILTLLLALLPSTDWLNVICFYGPVGLALGEKRLMNLTGVYQVGISIGTAFVGSILWYNVISFLYTGRDLIDLMIDGMKASLANKEFMSMITSAYGEIPAGLEGEILDMTLRIMPSMLFMIALVFVLLNAFLLRFGIRITRTHKNVLPLNLELPRETLNLATVLLLGSLIVRVFDDVLGQTLLQNCILMLMVVFSIQGIIVLSHLLKANKVNQVGRFVAIILAMLFLQIFGLSVLGWLDLLIGIRRRFGEQ